MHYILPFEQLKRKRLGSPLKQRDPPLHAPLNEQSTTDKVQQKTSNVEEDNKDILEHDDGVADMLAKALNTPDEKNNFVAVESRNDNTNQNDTECPTKDLGNNQPKIRQPKKCSRNCIQLSPPIAPDLSIPCIQLSPPLKPSPQTFTSTTESSSCSRSVSLHSVDQDETNDCTNSSLQTTLSNTNLAGGEKTIKESKDESRVVYVNENARNKILKQPVQNHVALTNRPGEISVSLVNEFEDSNSLSRPGSASNLLLQTCNSNVYSLDNKSTEAVITSHSSLSLPSIASTNSELQNVDAISLSTATSPNISIGGCIKSSKKGLPMSVQQFQQRMCTT